MPAFGMHCLCQGDVHLELASISVDWNKLLSCTQDVIFSEHTFLDSYVGHIPPNKASNISPSQD